MILTPRTATNRVRTAIRQAGMLDSVVATSSTETAACMKTEVEAVTKDGATQLADALRATFAQVDVRNGVNIFTVVVKQPVVS